jgi:hypothetical protein
MRKFLKMNMLAFSLVQTKINRIKKYTQILCLDLIYSQMGCGRGGSRVAKFHLLGDTKVREWQ